MSAVVFVYTYLHVLYAVCICGYCIPVKKLHICNLCNYIVQASNKPLTSLCTYPLECMYDNAFSVSFNMNFTLLNALSNFTRFFEQFL